MGYCTVHKVYTNLFCNKQLDCNKLKPTSDRLQTTHQLDCNQVDLGPNPVDPGPKLKTTKMEDDQNGRQQKWKTTQMEDDPNGRRPKWKTTKMEDDLIEARDCGWRVNQPGNSAIPRFWDFL